MLDVVALVDSAGSTALTTLGTIAGGPDGQTVAGVPRDPTRKPTLAYLSFDELVAGTPFVDLRLLAQDLADAQNGLQLGLGYPPDHVVIKPMLQYKTGAIQPQFDQTAAARLNAALVWLYRGIPGTISPPQGDIVPAIYPQTFAGALTAGTWGVQNFSAFSNLPAGPGKNLAIFGWSADAITGRAIVRFSHAAWGSFKPGGPCADANVAITRNISDLPMPWRANGRQFLELSKELNAPLVPVFPISSSNGTGLQIEVLSNTADTPQITIYGAWM